MSRFFSGKYSALKPYTPGEQPKDMKYIKLNTNESPYMPSDCVLAAARAEAEKLHLYCDPECAALTKKLAERYNVSEDEIIVTNGSDEVLNFAFMAFCDARKGIAFPDITYGFYSVFAALNGIPYREIPLNDKFRINISDYKNLDTNIVIANPNAPTGIALSLSDIEEIVKANKENVVIIDEAYVDFGAESAVSLIHKYDNLLVTMTFSKSRSLAGGRVGFGIGSKELIRDLNTIKYSTNPYNVNRLSQACAAAAIDDDSYYMQNAKKIIDTRECVTFGLRVLGFEVLPSSANFVFAKHERIGGEELYLSLKERGILVRHFSGERIKEYNRITIGSDSEMKAFLSVLREIIKGEEL